MKKIGKKTSLLVLLVLTVSVGLFPDARCFAVKPAVKAIAEKAVPMVGKLMKSGDSSDSGGSPPSSASAPEAPAPGPAATPPSGPVTPADHAPADKTMDDLKKQAEEMRQKGFSDGYEKGFSQGFKGGKSVPVAHPVAPANPADQAILAKMGPLVTDDLKKQVEEKRQKAFTDGYNMGIASGKKAAASQKLAKA